MKLSPIALLSLFASFAAAKDSIRVRTNGKVAITFDDPECSGNTHSAAALLNAKKYCLDDSNSTPSVSLKETTNPDNEHIGLLWHVAGKLHEKDRKVTKIDPSDFIPEAAENLARILGRDFHRFVVAPPQGKTSPLIDVLPFYKRLADAGLENPDVFEEKINHLLENLEGKNTQKYKYALAHIINAADAKKTLRANHVYFLKKLDDTPEIIELVTENAMAALLSEEDACENLSIKMIAAMTVPQIQKLTGACLLKVKNLDTHTAWNASIRAVPEKALEEPELKLQGGAFRYMSSKQIAALDRGNTSVEDRCTNVTLGPYLEGNGHEMEPDCFAGALKASAAPVALGRAWLRLPENILSKAVTSDHLKNIPDTNFPHISIAQKKALVDAISAKENECDVIPERFLAQHADFAISNECWAKLSDRNKYDALLHSRLSDDVLANQEVDVINKMTDGNTTGISLLNTLGQVRNIHEIIAKMSTTHSGEHICSAVSEVKVLADNKVLQKYATKECVKAMSLKVGLSDLSELNDRIVGLINTEDIFEHIKDSDNDYRNMQPKEFLRLAEHSKLCSESEMSRIRLLDDEVWKVMTGKCLAAMKDLTQLKREDFEHIPPSAFQDLPEETMEKIKAHLSADQIKAAAKPEPPKEGEAKEGEAKEGEAKEGEAKEGDDKKVEAKKA